MRQEIRFDEGYDAREPELGAPSNILSYGSKNLLYQGIKHLENFKGLTVTNPITGGRIMFNFSDGYASLNDYDPGGGNIVGAGSIFISFGKTLWFVGAGKVFHNGSDLSATATSTLSFRKLTGGSYAGTTLSAGLAQPSAPTVAARTASFGPGLSGLLNGTYSVRITRIRSTSGAESIGSAPSAVISVSNGTIRIAFPSLDSNGQDRWGIYVTLAGFGAIGPYFLLKEIADTELSTIDGVARSYETEWADGGLLPILVPTDNYPPPACTHAIQLEDVTCAIGCYGDTNGISSTSPGNGIAYSIAGFPEAYPPDQLLFLPESPVHVLTRPSQRYGWVLMKNAVGALTYTGGTPSVSLEIVWENIGCTKPHHAVDVDGRLYAFAGGKLVRMGIGNEPEDSWADPIMRHLRDLNAEDVVLGYDSKMKTFLLMAGSTLYPFHVSTELWGTPLDISSFAAGSAVSAVTVNNGLKITVKNGSVFTLYDFNVGGGTTWEAWSNWRDAGDALTRKYLRYIGYAFQHDNLTFPNITVKLFGTTISGSFDNVNALKTITHTIAALSSIAFAPRPARTLKKPRRAFAVMMSGRGTGGDSRPIKITLAAEESEAAA